jgi:hypothetical protein
MKVSGTTPVNGVLGAMPDFIASHSGGSAWVRPVLWRSAPGEAKRWYTTAAIDTQRFTYTVGNLSPGAMHVVYKDGIPVQTLIADGTGHGSFEDVAGKTSDVEYMIQPHVARR